MASRAELAGYGPVDWWAISEVDTGNKTNNSKLILFLPHTGNPDPKIPTL